MHKVGLSAILKMFSEYIAGLEASSIVLGNAGRIATNTYIINMCFCIKLHVHRSVNLLRIKIVAVPHM